MKGSHEWRSGRRSRRGSEKGVLKRVPWGFRKGVPDRGRKGARKRGTEGRSRKGGTEGSLVTSLGTPSPLDTPS